MAHSSFGTPWPHCDRSNIITLQRLDGLRLPMHRDVVELVAILIDVTEALGYDIVPGWTWGYACRAIAGTTHPSNHSQGTAVDINAPTNPQSHTFRSNIPRNVVDLWKGQNFRWGGDYRPPTKFDPMHFEFMGTADEAKKRAVQLRAFLNGNGGTTPPPPAPVPTAYQGPPMRGPVSTFDARVRALQQQLVAKGAGQLRADGIFGQQTIDVVKFVQASNGLTVDGVVGPQTWALIFR